MYLNRLLLWVSASDRCLRHDSLAARGLDVPDPRRTFAFATACGLFVISLWTLRYHLGAAVFRLFAKEGPLEAVTFALELTAATLCFAAAWHWRAGAARWARLPRVLFAALGVLLFLVGMEEISWGQTFFGFATPESWAQINYQRETSLHNLVDKTVLTGTWKLVAVAFSAGVLGIVALAARYPGSPVSVVAPHAALVPLALCATFAGVALHPEMIELLLSVFFTFYSYRIWKAARSSRTDVPRPTAKLLNVGRVLRYSVAALLVVVLLAGVNWAEAARDASRISAWMVAAAFLLMGFGLLVSAWKWDWSLRLHGLRYPLPTLTRVLCIGFFFNNFLPTAVGGDAYRILRTMPREGYRSRALSAVVVERLVGLLALLALGGIGAAVLFDDHTFAREYVYGLFVVLALAAAGFVALRGGLIEQFASKWRRIALVDALHHNLVLLRRQPRAWLGLSVGSVAFQVVSITALFLLFGAVSGQASPWKCALIAAVVGVAAALPISVNGVGVMEGALVAAAVALRLDYEEAVIVAFARRALTTLLAVPCGVLWLTEARQAGSHENAVTLTGLFAAFRASGLRGLFEAMQPPPALREVVAEAQPSILAPDVPLDEGLAATEDWPSASLLEYTHDAIVIWELHGNGILWWNRAAEQLYGYSRDEARGRTTHELLKTELAGGISALEDALARFGVWVGELRHTTRSGERVHVEGRLALMSQNNGRWLVLEVNRDITDRVAAEAARAEMERQLAELRAERRAPHANP